MFVTLEVFGLDKSSDDFKDEQSENIELKFLALDVFHFDIS